MAVPKRKMSRANTRTRRSTWKADLTELNTVKVAGRDVGCDVSGVDVGDGRDEGGAEERDELVVVLGGWGAHGVPPCAVRIVRLPEILPSTFV